MTNNILYFDYAATTPCAPEVADAMYACLKDDGLYANASSAHGLAYSADAAMQESRSLVADLINADAEDIIFTSGATESNNLALIGLSEYLKSNGKTHIVSSATEHKAILDTLKYIETQGHSVTLVSPNKDGLLAIDDVQQAIQPDTGLVSVMHVNNETGVIQDIGKIGALAHKHGAAFHVDAAQSAGKLPIDVDAMQIDLLSICAHKFYGPKGSGALYISRSLRSDITPQLHGGGQEGKLRPGTYANHQIVGLGKTIELAIDRMADDQAHVKQIREIMLSELEPIIASVNGDQTGGWPGILNISVDGVEATTLLTTLQNKVALATGSACNSGTVSPSHVLTAMGIKGDQLDNALRISFGRYTTAREAREACQIIRSEVERIGSCF